ncbi:hypothetical protein [Pseudomonas sp. F3-2]|uniref:hypothetical protein n=1 Tax=Pseudomonas sp. F3-2 TaxID=3141539 RepID=UPI00315C7564
MAYEVTPEYDLGFVEYSERGNDFSPAQTDMLLEKIKTASQGEDVALVVFVHGWKHNASTEDENVKSFKDALSHIYRSKVAGKKKLIGVYIGWRGMSFHGLQLENLTFWDRKAAAEEVGRGGVTEFVVRLEAISKSRPGNFMLTAGHSFGSAIVLSALGDTLMEKMLDLQNHRVGVEAFGDVVVLLNPAVEANLGLLLKENSMKVGHQQRKVPTLMYVVSSRADSPTNTFFPIGQWFGVTLTWNEVVIDRNYPGQKKTYHIPETELDRITIGNYERFWTGYMDDVMVEGPSKLRYQSVISDSVISDSGLGVKAIGSTDTIGKWGYKSYCSNTLTFNDNHRLPCYADDPINFISAPESFIENHNDVFNDSVKSLLATAVMESLIRKQQGPEDQYCQEGGEFSFGKCFTYYYEVNRRLSSKVPLVSIAN